MDTFNETVMEKLTSTVSSPPVHNLGEQSVTVYKYIFSDTGFKTQSLISKQ